MTVKKLVELYDISKEIIVKVTDARTGYELYSDSNRNYANTIGNVSKMEVKSFYTEKQLGRNILVIKVE